MTKGYRLSHKSSALLDRPERLTPQGMGAVTRLRDQASNVSMKPVLFVLAFGLTVPIWSQSSAGRDVGSGAASIGKGAASGAADVGKGTAGAVGNLATGHPVSAATSLGKGVGKGGAHVALGTAKGAGKIGKGVGVGLKKLTHL